METQLQSRKRNRVYHPGATKRRPIMVLVRINAAFSDPVGRRHLKELLEHSNQLTSAMDIAESLDELVRKDYSDANKKALYNAYMVVSKCAKEASVFLDTTGVEMRRSK